MKGICFCRELAVSNSSLESDTMISFELSTLGECKGPVMEEELVTSRKLDNDKEWIKDAEDETG